MLPYLIQIMATWSAMKVLHEPIYIMGARGFTVFGMLLILSGFLISLTGRI